MRSGRDWIHINTCTANRSVNGKTHTVRFHVDYSMSGHVDKKVNDKFLMWPNEQCGECGEVKAMQGHEHDYLGMIFRFKEGKVEIDVTEHIKNVVDEFLIKFKEIWQNMTPAGVDLFNRDTSEKLNEEMKCIFVCSQNVCFTF